jgi:hypothetical protein
VSTPVRVLLLELPQLLRDILEHAIRQQTDCELLKDMRDLAVLSGRTVPPDIVVLGLTEAPDATLVTALLARWPMTRVVTVRQSGDDAIAYELRPQRRKLGPLSPTEIVGMLRQVVHESRGLWE